MEQNMIEQVLEFTEIKKKWKELAMTECAKERITKCCPYLSESELTARQRETTEAKQLIEKAGNPPLPSMEGLHQWIAAAKAGGLLAGEEIEGVGAVLTAVSRLKRYLDQSKQYGVSLSYYDENLDELEELKELIQLQIQNGQVVDNASKLLKTLRNEIERTKEKMRQKADIVIRANKMYLSDSFSTFRGGHICVPVKKEYKYKIKGTVLDKSSTGSTVFIEPEASARYYEELQLLEMDEDNEVRRILYELTGSIADAAPVLETDIKMMEKLDFIFSKGKLSFVYDGREPGINVDRYIRLKAARHPLMEQKTCVPLHFEVGNEIRGIIITGPNTGGKTVAIKTVALNCMMAQCGLHVAAEEADICMNSNFLCDIGDGQNLSENLSTFSAHILNVLDILRHVGRESLVIMDELGSGTDPTEGMGIAIAILEELKKSGALFLVTTHYPEVKQYAQQEEGIVNARMTFDRESLRPLYQLVIGEAGESCAFYIAKKLGMPSEMLRCAAKAAYQEQEEKKPDLESSEGEAVLKKEPPAPILKRKKIANRQQEAEQFQIGDSVMVYPEKKIGIVCERADDKGNIRVQLPGRKNWISHKRLKLHVAASQLYPENYDFSILFDTVEQRKLSHQMERKYVQETLQREE